MARWLVKAMVGGGWLLLITVGVAAGTTIYVNGTCGNDIWSGASADCAAPGMMGPKLRIKEAMAAAVDGDEVVVAAGTYSGPRSRNLSFAGRSITVRGQGGPGECVIDCRGLDRAFKFVSGEGPNSVLEGFTIINGRREGADSGGQVAGGGILFDSSSPTIRNCVVRECEASSFGVGGGIACVGGASPTLIDCEIVDNMAGLWGGGVYVNAGSAPTFKNCRISGNGVGIFGAGGGVYCEGAGNRTWLEGCRLSDNSAATVGGGMISAGYDCHTVLQQCMIVGNAASEGGGLCVYDQSATVAVNCTFNGNEANGIQGQGGAGISVDGELTLANAIMWGNDAVGAGKELSVGGTQGILLVSHSTVTGGQAGVAVASGGQLIWGLENGSADPLFVRPGVREMGQWQEGDYHLRSQQGRWHGAYHSNADLTGEGRVDMHDFAQLSREWMRSQWGLAEDLDGSGIVDAGDVSMMAEQWLSPGWSQTPWALDAETSPSVDAGDMVFGWGGELWPHGERVNQGAYGGTTEASFSADVSGNIGDVNGDNKVNLGDMDLLAEQWNMLGASSGDINRDGRVGQEDVVVLAENWLWQGK